MSSYSGRFQYLDANGGVLQDGACQLSFDSENLTLVPGAAAPLAFDLGDIDAFLPADYEVDLALYTGRTIHLRQFGKTFQNLCHDLLEAYRDRLIRCLLLEDLEEVTRFTGAVRLASSAGTIAGPAEIRVYKSNLAVLPTAATAFQWRLAEIDALQFDSSTYTVTLQSSDARLEITKLAKRTEEFANLLRDSLTALNAQSVQAVHSIFPFLNPDQLQRAAQLMKEGRGAPLAKLKAIHPRTEAALLVNGVGAGLKPYFDSLLGRVAAGGLYAGFKFIREEEEAADRSAEAGDETADRESGEIAAPEIAKAVSGPAGPQKADQAKEGAEPILFWFFFPLAAKARAGVPSNVVAWEATSRSGRATYFFRLVAPEQAGGLREVAKAPGVVEAAIRQLNRALVLLNFRREPIYLPDDSLELQPKYRKHAIACRKIAELRHLRASFLGRAIHTSPEQWEKQVEEILEKAGA
ncbi:MAG: hypothetical protein HY237_01950 [Acidobacteria bacterium]|nr:hypothetical protein [Acidobacteriota bacterium]